MNYIQDAMNFYKLHYEKKYGRPKGCTETDVVALEKLLECKLPSSYRQYLLWMGADYGGIFQGSNWFASNVQRNNFILGALLEENRLQVANRDNVLTFFSHQGYMAAWFELPCLSEDPDCFFLIEEVKPEDAEIKKLGRFSEVLLNDLRTFVST